MQLVIDTIERPPDIGMSTAFAAAKLLMRSGVLGLRLQAPGRRSQVASAWLQVPGSQFLVTGSRFSVPGSRF
jgi:hypothetical protein